MDSINLVDVIVTIILIAIIGGALAYIIKAKKNGQKCIGCPSSKQCGGSCNCKKQEDKEQSHK